jgi:hypothetical protein
MVDIGYVEATNKIVLAGQRLTVEKEIETATTMYAGRLVKKGSTDNEVVVGTDGAVALGWLGYEDTPIMYRPATIDTIYVESDRAAVVSGPIVLRALLANGDDVIMGNKLTGTAAGALKKWVPVPIDAASAEEFPVAIAMESVATTGAAKNIIIRSLI